MGDDDFSPRGNLGSVSADSESAGGWLERRPGLVSILAAAGLFGFLQAVILLSRSQSFPGGLELVVGMFKLGLISGVLTWLLLVLPALLLRRLHPAWRRGDRLQASWSVCLGLTAAMAAWISAGAWAAGPNVPDAMEPWVALTLALCAGILASFVRLPSLMLRLGALTTVALIILALLPIGPSWSGGTAAPVPKAELPADPSAPDVVLVSIDTLRADRLGAYGWSPSITPEMDRLADEGVVFRRTLASSPWTLPSVASMLTGLSTLHHGAGEPLSSGLTFLRSPLESRFTTLAERFAAAGYRTRAVVSNPFLSPDMGLAQGFQEFESPFGMAMGAVMISDLPLGRLLLAMFPIESWADFRAEGITGRALQWLQEPDTAPLFLWAHYIDPHSPYQADPRSLDLSAMMDEARQIAPEVLEDGTVVGESFAATSFVRAGVLWLGPEDRQRIQEYYNREVGYLDQQLGRIFKAVRGRTGRPVILALTADHGEEFWDHGHFEHGHDYYREITEIPLIFWGPGLIPSGREIANPVGLVDVGPTLLSLAGLGWKESERTEDGRPLDRLWSHEKLDEYPSVPRFSGQNLYGLPAVLVEQGPWRYILRANGVEELYDVTRDPAERHNRTADYPEVATAYRQLLEPQLARYLHKSAQPPEGISEETLRALRSLGYVR